MKKAVFFDIDGTLLDTSKGVSKITSPVKDAIRELQNNDILVFVSSGRPYAFLNEDILTFGFDGYILMNGSLILLNDNKSNDYKKIQFIKCLAQEYKIKICDNKFYFFNPFSLQIFMKVVNNILDSVDENMRIVDIILYYPSDDYIFYLENSTCFSIYKEVPVFPEYLKDNRNKFLIYRLDYNSI